MASLPVARPSDGALRTALQAVLAAAQPPPLVPHPPARNLAWRTRRIVAELKSLTNVDALSSYETELRGLVDAQETRCRTKLLNRAYAEECALREVEVLEAAEATARRELIERYYAMATAPFELIHLQLLEELARRRLRTGERAARQTVRFRLLTAQLSLVESQTRDDFAALESCAREELQCRRVIELGDALQREIVVQDRLSGHLWCVDHSRSVERARRQLEWQEEQDRSAVARLYELHGLLLMQEAKANFTATIQRDVLLLSDAGHTTMQRTAVDDCAALVHACVESEQRLRLMVEEQEQASFRPIAQAFLLGWRDVYKEITKDPDMMSVFCKIELLVRRDITDQQRAAFGAMLSASHTHMAMLSSHRMQRRNLCADYITGARAIAAEEGSTINALVRESHMWRHQQAALQRVAVLAAAEVTAGRAVRGAEAQERLALKIEYLLAKACLQAGEARRPIEEEEASCFAACREQYMCVFYVQGAERLVAAEQAARVHVEWEESTAAVDVLLPFRQTLAHSFMSDAARPLSRLEDEFRALLVREEALRRRDLACHQLGLRERQRRSRLEWEERNFRLDVAIAQLCADEELARRLVGADVEAVMAAVRRGVLEEWERESRQDLRKGETLVREGFAFRDTPCAQTSPWRLTGTTDMWDEMEAEWGEGASDTAAWTSEWPMAGNAPLAYTSGLYCEDVLIAAYLERDAIHFMEHREWLQLLHTSYQTAAASASPAAPRHWTLHSLSMQLEPEQSAASINIWHSDQSFDAVFSLTQEPAEAIVGERTISFYAPDASTTAVLMPRNTSAGMIFFLVLDEEGTVMASATVVMEMTVPLSAHLCIPLDNGRGFVRLV